MSFSLRFRIVLACDAVEAISAGGIIYQSIRSGGPAFNRNLSRGKSRLAINCILDTSIRSGGPAFTGGKSGLALIVQCEAAERLGIDTPPGLIIVATAAENSAKREVAVLLVLSRQYRVGDVTR